MTRSCLAQSGDCLLFSRAGLWRGIRWRFSAWLLTWETRPLLSLATAIEETAMASQPGLGTDEEKRIAQNDQPYTLEEFREYYGEDWNDRWEEAPIATADGAPQPGAAAGPSDGGTTGQQPPQAQAAPTNARAPQPGGAAGPIDGCTPGQQFPQAQASTTNAGAPQPSAAAGSGVRSMPAQQPRLVQLITCGVGAKWAGLCDALDRLRQVGMRKSVH